MSYQPFDIVMLRPEFGSKIFAIVGVEPQRPKNELVAVRMDKGPLTKRYRLADDHILAKIGALDPEALKLDATPLPSEENENWQLGQHYARFMAQQAPAELERRRWALLARLQPNDPVAISRHTRGGKRIERHRFLEVLPNGQKYHFTAVNPNGTVYRWTLDSLDLGTDVNPSPDADLG